MYSFCNFEPVCCSKSGSNCYFLTCIQVSQETGKVVWYSHLLKNVPQFVVIHTVKTSSFFLELFLCSLPLTYQAPSSLGGSSSGVIAFCLFILFMGFSRQEYWSGLPFPPPEIIDGLPIKYCIYSSYHGVHICWLTSINTSTCFKLIFKFKDILKDLLFFILLTCFLFLRSFYIFMPIP